MESSPHGSVMSCQSLAARAFVEPEKDSMTHSTGLHRTVRFSSESRSSNRTHNVECKRETPGSISLTALPMTPVSSQMSQSAPSHSGAFDLSSDTPPPSPACRFPKLEECAHFHYELVSLGGLHVQLAPDTEHADHYECRHEDEGWVTLTVRSHVNSSDDSVEVRNLSASWNEANENVREWTLVRNTDNFLQLDEMLHRCIYDRKVSGLPNLTEKLSSGVVSNEAEFRQLISDYVHHLSIIADDSINCAPVLNWLQCDNKGHRLLVSNEDSSSINTPAVAAAYSVRKYVSQARDEISFEVGDMISIIDMPGPQESVWWRGKRGFRVGFFPHHCVAVIGDKVPRHMTQPPPIVGSVAVAPIKPVLRKHGKLISLFRSFILSRPSRRSLKQQGILKERVFGCDLGEHLLNCQHEVPLILVECCTAIEARGVVDGVYRLSGGSGLTQRLRAAFDSGAAPDLRAQPVQRDPHAVPSLLKMYCRELPNPLCTYQLYDSFVRAVQRPDEASRLRAVRDTVVKLPPPHYRTLSYLMRHLRRVSLQGASTGMTARNMAIVWAPNLLRSPAPQHALQGVAVQAVVTEFLICYAEELFAEDQGDSGPSSVELESMESQIEYRNSDSCSRRPKSLPLHPPTKLLSLEEARRRGKAAASIQPAPTNEPVLRVESHLKPKYIEVGSGPNNLPQYHTVLDLPVPGSKRGLKRSPSGWRGLFARNKQRARHNTAPVLSAPPPPAALADVSMVPQLRPVKSCESLTSETDTLAPLAETNAPLKHHTRSSSCDSYFEPWQAELADMRLRLSPQERDHHMFSEEDDTHAMLHHDDSLCSTPGESGLCSVEPSPRKGSHVDADANDYADRKRLSSIEEQLSSIGYIDAECPRNKPAAEKRTGHPNTHTDIAKRLCTDRDSPRTSPRATDLQTSIANVKLRERSSPRKTKNSSRYSGMHQPVNLSNETEAKTAAQVNSRLSWHGKDGHSTLIKVDWPLDNQSASNLTASTVTSTPLTPVTPLYDPLESDSDRSDANKQTIKVESQNCENCHKEKCLKCELKATDYENVKGYVTIDNEPRDSLEPSPVKDISYQNLNRLSTSSNSEQTDSKKVTYENCDLKVMTSSHESSSSYSNISPMKNSDELYECYNFARPNYINLSSSSKSSPTSPLRSPLKSTISITFRSPTKSKSPDYEPIDNEDTPTNHRDSVYEDIDLEKNLSIVEEATVPVTDASLPTQQACQPDNVKDLIILETPTEEKNDVDVYSQVKFFKKSVEEVNALILESPNDDIDKDIKYRIQNRHYQNVSFEPGGNPYRAVGHLEICDKDVEKQNVDIKITKVEPKNQVSGVEADNGNVLKPKIVSKNLNVRELAHRFESPTEQKPAFNFDKVKPDVKYPPLDKEDRRDPRKSDIIVKLPPPVSPKTFKLTKYQNNARSLDENAFVREFGDRNYSDRRKSLDVKEAKSQPKFLPDLNLNLEESYGGKSESITPTTENKISLIQRFEAKKPTELTSLIGFEISEKKLSRERIEKYKEERRNFLREKYSSQSFRSNPENLTRLKIKKDDNICLKEQEDLPKFERRNTVDLGQRMRFSLAKSVNNLDAIPSPTSPIDDDSKSAGRSRDFERKEKVSPSYNIRDMAALFEQKSQSANNTNG